MAGCPLTYTVEISSDGGATWGNTQLVSHPTTTYSYNGLADGSYQVRVRANYTGGSSSWLSSDLILISSGFLTTNGLIRLISAPSGYSVSASVLSLPSLVKSVSVPSAYTVAVSVSSIVNPVGLVTIPTQYTATAGSGGILPVLIPPHL